MKRCVALVLLALGLTAGRVVRAEDAGATEQPAVEPAADTSVLTPDQQRAAWDKSLRDARLEMEAARRALAEASDALIKANPELSALQQSIADLQTALTAKRHELDAALEADASLATQREQFQAREAAVKSLRAEILKSLREQRNGTAPAAEDAKPDVTEGAP